MTDERSIERARGPLIQAAQFSPDGKWLVTGSFAGVLAVWDVESGRRLRVLLDPAGVDDAQQEEGSLAGGDEAEASFRPERPSECIRGSSILRLSVSADGRRLAVGSANGIVVVWNAESWREIDFWRPHDFGVTALEFSPDGRWLATGCAETGMTTLRVWKLEGPENLLRTEAFSSDRMIGGVYALAFSPDGRFLATGGWGNSGYSAPMIYELATGERVNTLPWDASRSLAYSPDGALLATGGEYGTVSLWDLATRKQIVEKKETHGRIVSVVAFSPDGRRLVSGSLDGGLKIWQVATGDLLEERSYRGSVWTCRFSQDVSALFVAEAAREVDHPTIHRVKMEDSHG